MLARVLLLSAAIASAADLDQQITARMAAQHIPGASVAVIDGGKIAWARGYGVTAAESGKPVNAETLFQAASISKHVAALIALHLVDEGKLSLDEDVNRKLRSWKVPENEFTRTEKVTLRRLLNHSAGLTVHGFPGYAAGEPVPTLVEVLDGKKPANTPPIRVDVVPGTLWRYSGGGYEVAQQLILDAAGKPFPQLAREIVFGPLEMSHSTFEQPLPARLESNAASGHLPTGAIIKGRWHTYPELAAAGLWTTPSDLARIVIELQTHGGHVIRPETERQMLTNVLGDYGLGLAVTVSDGQKSFGHGGSNEGFQCSMRALEDRGKGAVVMTNSDRGGAFANEVIKLIAAEYHWADSGAK
jgi:CubicO group peptidase (beta-lactamase class C family)